MSYVASVTCQFCGWDTEVEASTPEALRNEIDSIGCWHSCCKVCRQPIVFESDQWWHLAQAFSDAPKEVVPRGVDLDEDHQALPAQFDGDADA